MLAAGANVNVLGSNEVTPLILTARGGHTVAIPILVAAGTDLDTIEALAVYTALAMAITNGHRETVQALVTREPNGSRFYDRGPIPDV